MDADESVARPAFQVATDSDALDPSLWSMDGGRWTKRRRRDGTAMGDAGQVFQASAESPLDLSDSRPSRNSPKRRRGDEGSTTARIKSEEPSRREASEQDELWAIHEVTLLAKIPNALRAKDFRPIAALLYMLAETTCKSLAEPHRSQKVPPSTRGVFFYL